MQFTKAPRGVRYEPEFSEALDAACQKYSMVEDVIAGLEWRLDREPHSGQNLGGGFFVYRQDGSARLNAPSVLLLYSHTDDQLVFHAAEFEDPHPPRSESEIEQA